jgi:hypothetical protein
MIGSLVRVFTWQRALVKGVQRISSGNIHTAKPSFRDCGAGTKCLL